MEAHVHRGVPRRRAWAMYSTRICRVKQKNADFDFARNSRSRAPRPTEDAIDTHPKAWQAMLMLALASLLASSFAVTAPAVPATLDTTQPTCLALSSTGAEGLYLVPREVCDSRTCKLVLELQPVSAWTGAPAPTVIA